MAAADTRERLQRHLADCWRQFDVLREQMVALQEEIDWHTYVAFGLAPADVLLPPDSVGDGLCCPRGSRSFEHITPRKSFVRARDHLVPLAEAEVPPVGQLSPALERLTQHRIAAIQASPELTLIEQPLFKRQWRDTDDNIDEFAFRRKVDQSRLAAWLLDQLEAHLRAQAVHGPACVSLRELSREFLLSPRFIAVSALYSGQNDPDLEAVLNDLVPPESVPYLSIYRYSESGLAKHRAWHHTWARQQQEDQGLPPPVDDQGQPIPIPVPPRYDSDDFRDPACWRLRGKLDVPRERFISFPGCERADDPSRVIGWAGWDPVQRAIAIMNLFHARKAQETWDNERLALLLRGVRELGLWLSLWHDQPSPDFDGERPGALFERLVDSEARAIGFAPEALDALAAPAPRPGGRRGRG